MNVVNGTDEFRTDSFQSTDYLILRSDYSIYAVSLSMKSVVSFSTELVNHSTPQQFLNDMRKMFMLQFMNLCSQ